MKHAKGAQEAVVVKSKGIWQFQKYKNSNKVAGQNHVNTYFLGSQAQVNLAT